MAETYQQLIFAKSREAQLEVSQKVETDPVSDQRLDVLAKKKNTGHNV
jgi:beta-xylosidase